MSEYDEISGLAPPSSDSLGYGATTGPDMASVA